MSDNENLPSQIIAKARQRLGISEHQAAVRLGLSVPAYFDLESDDEEIFIYSIVEMFEICEGLGLKFCELLNYSPDLYNDSYHSMNLKLKSMESVLSRSEFLTMQDSIGWYLQPVLEDGYHVVNYTLDALEAICRYTGNNYYGVLTSLCTAWRERRSSS